MCGANNRVDMHNRHNSVAIIAVVRLEHPQTIVWVGIIKALAEFMDKGAFERLVSEREREKEVYPPNI